MKTKLILILLLFFSTHLAFSQLDLGSALGTSSDKRIRKRRFTTGGGIALGFGNRSYVDVSGKLGYFALEDLMPYTKLRYLYLADRRLSLSNHVVGFSLGANYFIRRTPVSLTVEYEKIAIFRPNKTYDYDNFLAGGGFNIGLAENIITQLSVLFQLNSYPIASTISFPNPRISFTLIYLL